MGLVSSPAGCREAIGRGGRCMMHDIGASDTRLDSNFPPSPVSLRTEGQRGGAEAEAGVVALVLVRVERVVHHGPADGGGVEREDDGPGAAAVHWLTSWVGWLCVCVLGGLRFVWWSEG